MNENNALILPSKDVFIQSIKAINEFQQLVHANMIAGSDFGVIPGTGGKPTLLKPGAEKIAKLLGLADSYEILDRQEDWTKGFFRYIVKCRLTSVSHGVVISEGMGECNSMESKYRWRWIGDRDLPAGTDISKLVSQTRKSRSGGQWTVYRFENDDIYSQVNTILKMAKKRALVDAALSAGRLSEVFTQDVEDLAENGKIIDADATTGEIKQPETTGEHLCKIHKDKDGKPIAFFKTARMRGYAHKIDGTDPVQWCNEDAQDAPQSTPVPAPPEGSLSVPKVSVATYKALQEAQANAVVTNQELAAEVTSRGWTVKSAKQLTEPQAEQIIKWLKGKVGANAEPEPEPLPF